MTKFVCALILALLYHLTFLHAADNDPDQIDPTLLKRTNIADKKEDDIDDEYDLIKDKNLLPPTVQVGLVNLPTIIKGAISAYHQYGTKDMTHYGFAYDKVCAGVVKDLISDHRYLVNFLETPRTNLFALQLGSIATSYLFLIHICNAPANYFNAALSSMDAFFPYSSAPSFFDTYHIAYSCNTNLLYHLALLFGCASVYIYCNLPTYINNTLDRLTIAENVYDIKSQFDSVTVKYLCHSIEKPTCENPLVKAMYPNALRFKTEYKKRDISPQELPKATKEGKYKLWQIIYKLRRGAKLSDTEQENYNTIIAFPLFRYEYGLTRLWEEPMNLWIILRKLCGFKYIFDKDETHMNTIISNINKVIKMISTENKIPYLESQIFNQDIATQEIIASFASNPNLASELEDYNIVSLGEDDIDATDKAKFILANLIY